MVSGNKICKIITVTYALADTLDSVAFATRGIPEL